MSKCLQSGVLIFWQVEVLLVSLSISDHTDLMLHLSDSRLTNARLLPLSFGFFFQSIDSLEQQFAVMSLLTDIDLHLLVVSVDLRLHIRINFFDLLTKLGHQLISIVSQLLGLLLELIEEVETQSDLVLYKFSLI
jgi:hypothetical protein